MKAIKTQARPRFIPRTKLRELQAGGKLRDGELAEVEVFGAPIRGRCEKQRNSQGQVVALLIGPFGGSQVAPQLLRRLLSGKYDEVLFLGWRIWVEESLPEGEGWSVVRLVAAPVRPDLLSVALGEGVGEFSTFGRCRPASEFQAGPLDMSDERNVGRVRAALEILLAGLFDCEIALEAARPYWSDGLDQNCEPISPLG